MAGGRRKNTHVSADDLVDTGPESPPETVQEEAEESPPLLPWLEAIDEDEDETKPQGSSGLLGFGLAAAALVAGLGIYAFATRNPSPTDLAGPADTETPPDLLDSPAPLTEQPESPRPAVEKHVPVRPAAKSAEAKAPRLAAAPVKKSHAILRSRPSAKEAEAKSSIQLASYYSRRRAEEYWKQVSRRHKQLAALDHETVQGSVNGRTVYRLRAFGSGEAELCERLQSRGVPCLRIGHD